MKDVPPTKPVAPLAPPPAPLPPKIQAPGVPKIQAPMPPLQPPVAEPGPEAEEPAPSTQTTSTTTQDTVARASADSRVPLPGETVLGEYTIIRKLGQGGFGITYLARHTEKGTVVVIKEHMPDGLAVREPDSCYVAPASPEVEESFRHTMEEFSEEVTVLQGLEHPGIVPILSGFAANGTAYYVMPYVEGKTLDISGKPTLDNASRQRHARVIRQQLSAMLDILEYMEQHQVVHRDIKPENIVVNNEGQLILLDFGSARQLRPGKVFRNIYTPDFCAPEQSESIDDAAMCAKIGPWTDIYSLGATFHYLITRMLPPRADMRGHAEQDPYKPLASRADLCKLYGAAFLQSIDRAMELLPKDRWQSVVEWRQSTVTGLLPATPRVLRRARFFMAGSVLLASVFGGICLWAIKERNQAVQMYNLSLQLSERILYDFNEELSDMPGATKLQAQLVTQLKNYLDGVDKLSLANDEKLQRALSSAWRNLGYIYMEQGDLEASTEALLRATSLQEQLVHDYPEQQAYRYDMARIWLYRAEVARRRNHNSTAAQFVSQARDTLRELCEQAPGIPEYRCALGRAIEETGSLARTNGNLELYEQSIQEQLKLYGEMAKDKSYAGNVAVQTGFGYAWLAHGQLCMDTGKDAAAMEAFEEGRKIFAKLTADNPYRLSFKKGLASAYLSMGMLHSRMAEQAPSYRRRLEDAALSDYERQLKLVEELAALDSGNAEYTYLQCRTMSLMVDILLRNKRVNQAEFYCKTILQKVGKLLETAPDNADYAVIKAGALRSMAMTHGNDDHAEEKASEEFGESRDILEQLLRQSPGNLSMRFLYTEVLAESARHAAEKGDIKTARAWLEKAIAIVEALKVESPQNKMLNTRLDVLRKQLDALPSGE